MVFTLIASADVADGLQPLAEAGGVQPPEHSQLVTLTADLRLALKAWAQLSLDHHRRGDLDEEAAEWDWLDFHAKGRALAAQLKAEAGPGVRVLYAKPQCDPNHRHLGLTELRAQDDWVVLPDVDPPVLRWCTLLISGGQTGADRAALDFAIRHGCPHGGWAPAGRLAEDGPIPRCYQLTELAQGGYRQRMRRNVADSDATLVFNLGALDGGTWATVDTARRLARPHRVVPLDGGVSDDEVRAVLGWLRLRPAGCLNIAGPREGKRPGTHALTLAFLESMLRLDQNLGA